MQIRNDKEDDDDDEGEGEDMLEELCLRSCVVVVRFFVVVTDIVVY